MVMRNEIRLRRSLLFLPASRPDRFKKALETGADAVCIDLEDGVAIDVKHKVRDQAFDLLRAERCTSAELILRINDPSTELGLGDLRAFCESGTRPDALMLPKVMSPVEISRVERILQPYYPELAIVPMVETAEGLAAAKEISMYSKKIKFLFFGGVDFSADLGCTNEWDSLLYARSRLIHTGALAGIGVMDTPYMDVADLDGLETETRAIRRLGFSGKAAIHPTQVPVIQNVFSPSEAEVMWAKRIVKAYEENKGGVLLVDGKLIERPVIKVARRTLAIERAVKIVSSPSDKI